MIEIKHLYHRYIREYFALFDINLHIEKGEKVALVGSEDSGKTSLIRILSKLEKPSSGEILIDGKSLTQIDFKSDISVGYIPVYPIFFEKKTVCDNLEYILKFRKMDKEKYQEFVSNALKNYGLEKYKDVQVKKLSLYEKYKLSFARLSLRKLDLLLIDNIFDNFCELHEDQKEDILNVIINFYKEKDLTMLLATSNIDFSHKFSDRQIFFKSGSIVENLD